MNEITLMKQTQSNMMLFDDTVFAQLERIATMMTSGQVMMPKHLKAKGDCFAVVMQAAQWGMNPYAVAQKTFLVSGTLGYEAQLINAVISTSSAIKGHFHYEYGGDWESIAGRPSGKKQIADKYNAGQKKWIDVKGWGDEEEKGLFIKVGAKLAGDDNITWGEPVYLAPITIRNSGLWVTDPKQQIAYLSVKKWARMYTPGVILGVYTPDEIEARDITPVAYEDFEKNDKLEAHKAKIKSAKQSEPIEGKSEEVKQAEPEPKPEPQIKPPTLTDFKKLLVDSFTPEAMKERKLEIGLMAKSNKDKAIKLFSERLATLKAPVEAKQEEESRPIDEAYKLMGVAKTSDDLDVAVDFVLSLNQEGKVTKDELNEFQIASDVKFDSFSKPE